MTDSTDNSSKKPSTLRTAVFRENLKSKGLSRSEVIVPQDVKSQLIGISGNAGLSYVETASAILELGLSQYNLMASTNDAKSSPILDFLQNRSKPPLKGESNE